MRTFWAKYIFFELKLKSDAKFEEKLTCGLKMTWGISEIFTRALQSVKIETLMGPFRPK